MLQITMCNKHFLLFSLGGTCAAIGRMVLGKKIFKVYDELIVKLKIEYYLKWLTTHEVLFQFLEVYFIC